MKAYIVYGYEEGELVFANHYNQAKRIALKQSADLREDVDEGYPPSVRRVPELDKAARRYAKPAVVNDVALKRDAGFCVECAAPAHWMPLPEGKVFR